MGDKQIDFTDYEPTTTKNHAKREQFLAEMAAVVPWDTLIDLSEPF